MAFRARYSNSAQYYLAGTTPILRIANAIVTILNAGTGTAFGGTLYVAAAGGTTLSNPFTTDASGHIEFYLDAPLPVKIQITKPSDPTIGTLIADFEPVMPDPRDIVTGTKGAFVYLMDYASGLAIGNDALDGTFAFQAALDAATNGQTILVPPGTYRIGRITPLPGVTLFAQAGGGFVTLKRKDSYGGGALWDASAATDTCLDGVWVNGNATGGTNSSSTLGVQTAEVMLGGTRNKIRDARISNFNHTGLHPYGQDNTVEDLWLVGQNLAAGSYATTQRNGGSYVTSNPADDFWNLGSLYGMNVANGHFCDGLYLKNVHAVSMRSAGIVLGGTNIQADGIFIEDCHRQYLPYQTVGGSITQGGGQFALSQTVTAVGGAQRPGRMTFNGLYIGPSSAPATLGLQASGIDFDSCDDIDIIGAHIEQQANVAISLGRSTGIRVRGGDAKRTALGGIYGVGIFDCQGVEIDGIDLENHSIGVKIEPGTNEDISLRGIGFKGCTANITVGTPVTIARLTSLGHRVKTGPACPSILPTGSLTVGSAGLTVSSFQANNWAAFIANSAAGGSGSTSDGLLVRAGIGGNDTVGAFESKDASTRHWTLTGDSAILHLLQPGATHAYLMSSNTAALREMVKFRRSVASVPTTMWSLGLDASDNAAFLDAAGAALLAIDKTTGRLSGPGVNWTSFVPTVDQTATGIALSSNPAEYAIIGKIAFVNFNLTVSGSGSGSVAINVTSIPAAIQPLRTGTFVVLGGGAIYDTSASTVYVGQWVANAASTWALVVNAAAGNYAGATPAFNLGAGDTLSGSLCFEVA